MGISPKTLMFVGMGVCFSVNPMLGGRTLTHDGTRCRTYTSISATTVWTVVRPSAPAHALEQGSAEFLWLNLSAWQHRGNGSLTLELVILLHGRQDKSKSKTSRMHLPRVQQ